MASAETTFSVAGQDVPPSPSLVIHGLGFYRTADEETPLRVAAYRAGDMVWMKFDATGYKYGEQNAIDVSYDVAVFSGGGQADVFAAGRRRGKKPGVLSAALGARRLQPDSSAQYEAGRI